MAAVAAEAAEGPRPEVTYGPLTAFWLFCKSKRTETEAAGARALEVPEVMRMWRALSQDERRKWEEVERVEQKRYFTEMRARSAWDHAQGQGAEDDAEVTSSSLTHRNAVCRRA